MKINNKGLTNYQLIFIIGTALVLIIIAYYGLSNNNPPKSSFLTVPTNANQNYLSVTVPTAPQITKASDLKIALDSINDTDVGLNSTDSNVLAQDSKGF